MTMTICREHIPKVDDVIKVDGRCWLILEIISVSKDAVIDWWKCKIKVGDCGDGNTP